MPARARDEVGTEGWGAAGWKAVVVLAASGLSFVLIPDRLVAFLSTRVGPGVRDALLALWVTVAFIVLSWTLVQVQRRRRA